MKGTTKPTKRNKPEDQSLWGNVARPRFRQLRENIRADVCVVGAGIAGLSSAYFLTKQEKSVVVIDDGVLAGGVTEVTTAHLSNAIDDRYFRIEYLHGEAGAQLAAQSHSAAIDHIEAVVHQEKIACDFERLDGYLFLAPHQDKGLMDRELAAANNAGLVDVVMLPQAPLKSFDTGPCLRFPRQAQFHPLKYAVGLAKAIERAGGRIYLNTHADRIEGGPSAEVKAGRYSILADAIVVATNTPINDLVAIHTKQAAYMTYVIGGRVPTGSVTPALYWDTNDPYHYVRLQRVKPSGTKSGLSEYDLLIVGGEDHKTGQAESNHDPHARLEAWARERFPIEEVEYRWGGQVMETIDGLAYIGRNPLDAENVYVVTGDSGMGMTHGTIAGLLISDLIQGLQNPWASLYDPSRITLRAAGTFAKEALNMAAQYARWLTDGDHKVQEIAKESGAVIKRGLGRVAVYRDENGKLHECSAVCPHLGCLVAWNTAEKTWDCPCHGSRFNALGHVINGPANKDLPPVKDQ
jgi:glycine/D-amino acid oxidase-like deaminating enzyme/nitrite reductase/ring-hydroxylating ferredoxin subunit